MAVPSGRRAEALTRPDFSFERHLLATGETTHVICGSNGKPKSLPEKYRHVFSAALAPVATGKNS